MTGSLEQRGCAVLVRQRREKGIKISTLPKSTLEKWWQMKLNKISLTKIIQQ